jgi:hypothetical protein
MQPDVTSQKKLDPAVVADMEAVVQRARGGDVSALPRLRQILDEYPEIWQHTIDLGRIVETAWAERIAGKDLLALEAIRRQAEKMRADLSGPAPTPMEALLVERVVACWLEMNYALTMLNPSDSDNLKPAAFKLKHLESIERRFLAASKMLTTTRALLPKGLVPVEQVRLYKEERA